MSSVFNVGWVWRAVLGLMLFSAVSVVAEAPEDSTKTVVSNGKLVSLEYTLTLEDKTVVNSNVGGEAMTYTQGVHEIVPGLEKALEGLAVGDKKRVEVPPADAYGDVDPNAFREVKKSQIPEKALKVGAVLEAKSSDGQWMYPRVAEVKSETVILDFNHPMAGKTLIYEITILDIKPGVKEPS